MLIWLSNDRSGGGFKVDGLSVDLPSPCVVARGHANGTQGCWLLCQRGRRVPPPPDKLLEREPPDSPIFTGKT